jgi:DegV family protein with EDD domain
MSKVAIVTDSTADLPADFLKAYPIRVVPLKILWDGKTYQDGIEIQAQEFYQRLRNSTSMPTTSQATPEECKAAFESLLDEGYDVLGLFISAELSATFDSAQKAAADIGRTNVLACDSRSVSMAMGFQVLAAARAAAEGKSLEECRAAATQARDREHIYFVVQTLEYLRRGGRIGGAAAFLGTLLDYKPLLEIRNGRIEAVERVRSMGKAIERMIQLTENLVAGQRGPLHLAVVQADAEEAAGALLEQVKQRFGDRPIADSLVTSVSPVLGTHTGPGTLGLIALADS